MTKNKLVFFLKVLHAVVLEGAVWACSSVTASYDENLYGGIPAEYYDHAEKYLSTTYSDAFSLQTTTKCTHALD